MKMWRNTRMALVQQLCMLENNLIVTEHGHAEGQVRYFSATPHFAGCLPLRQRCCGGGGFARSDAGVGSTKNSRRTSALEKMTWNDPPCSSSTGISVDGTERWGVSEHVWTI